MPFAVINGAALARIQSDVREALVKYEPRIEVLGVAVSVGDAAAGKLAITLEYRVRDTNNAFNYVYDYYLHEGNG
jgi:phage baseplate assembly protein W